MEGYAAGEFPETAALTEAIGGSTAQASWDFRQAGTSADFRGINDVRESIVYCSVTCVSRTL